MHPIYAIEVNGPIIAAEMRALAAPHKFTVVVLGYDRANNIVGKPRRTIKAAYRELAHLISKKAAGRFAACIVTDDGHVMNYREARGLIGGK